MWDYIGKGIWNMVLAALNYVQLFLTYHNGHAHIELRLFSRIRNINNFLFQFIFFKLFNLRD